MTKEQTILITPQGYLALETELNDLKLKKRPEVIAALQEARSLGDLSENAEYDAARTEQALVEGKIQELEAMLENVEVIKERNTEVVDIGTNVKIKYDDDDETDVYTICGSKEVDPFNNKISNESPIAKALMHHKVGDVVTVESPNGEYNVEIKEIF